jgi:hypothetical protein
VDGKGSPIGLVGEVSRSAHALLVRWKMTNRTNVSMLLCSLEIYHRLDIGLKAEVPRTKTSQPLTLWIKTEKGQRRTMYKKKKLQFPLKHLQDFQNNWGLLKY